MCAGGFNEILKPMKKEGGHVRPMEQILAFREALTDCCLLDLGFIGNPLTWKTTRGGGIKKRLDRACATASWRNMFTVSKVTHLKSCKSDHIPLLLELSHTSLERNHRLFFDMRSCVCSIRNVRR